MKLTAILCRLLPIGWLALGCAATWANTATAPVPRPGPWLDRHQGFVQLANQGGIDVLFIGDSITDWWRNSDPRKGGQPVWDRHFVPLRAANFGIAGDRTQNVLWRLQHGEIAGLAPRVVVLLIGTNNTGWEADGSPRNTPAETVAGISAIVASLRAALPDSRILLLAIFPRGEKPDHPQRAQLQEINASIAHLHDGRHIHFLDLTSRFLAPDGTLRQDLMPDFLHPSLTGYQVWADALLPTLRGFLGHGPSRSEQARD